MRVVLLHEVVGQDMAVGKFDPRSRRAIYKDRSMTMSLTDTCEVGAVDGRTSSDRGEKRNVLGGALNMSGPKAS